MVRMTQQETSVRHAAMVWPLLKYRDARAAVRFLEAAFGLTVAGLHPEGDGPVAHGELHWPEGGGVMLSTAGEGDPLFAAHPPVGGASVYLVTADPDGLLARATAAGAEIARPIREEDYGSRGFTARDPEGNLWSFGTYGGVGLPSD